MELYTTGTGQQVWVHTREDCRLSGACVIHNPSDHHMRTWPTNWRNDRRLMERICPHGVGHPDPDDLEFKRAVASSTVADAAAVHGCDGCCSA